MKTPFVAHPPCILVIHAREGVVGRCRTAGGALGLPVLVAADSGSAADVARTARPLVLVCAAAPGLAAASLAGHLATQIDAVVVQIEGDEAPPAIEQLLREASVQAERSRAAASDPDASRSG